MGIQKSLFIDSQYPFEDPNVHVFLNESCEEEVHEEFYLDPKLGITSYSV